MRRQFYVEDGWTLKKVRADAAWAAKIIKVDGGWTAFESMDDYIQWEGQR